MSAAAWLAPTSSAAAIASPARSPTVTARAPRRLPARLLLVDTGRIVPPARGRVAGDLEDRDLRADPAALPGDGRLAEDLHAAHVRVPVGQAPDVAHPADREAVALRDGVGLGLLDADEVGHDRHPHGGLGAGRLLGAGGA